MGYDSQTKLVIKTIEEKPEFKKVIKDFRNRWTNKAFQHEQIIVKGQAISDKVIKELDL